MQKIALMASCAVAASVIFIGQARADVLDLNLKFGGGCVPRNAGGSCTLKVRAEGTELDTESVILYYRAKGATRFQRYSNRIRPLSTTGYARMRIRNQSDVCYQVRTAPNGNDKPDVRSNVVCE